MSHNKIIKQLKETSPLERAQITIPLTDGADIGEIFDKFLSIENIGFLSFLRNRQIPLVSLGMGISNITNPNDTQEFLNIVLTHYLMLTVTEQGRRSDDLTKIASGYLQMQQEIEIEQNKREQGIMDRIKSIKR